MLALVKESSKPREAAVSEVPDPQPGDDDVVIAIEACGICGSDLTFYDDPESLAKELGITFPVLFGHEFAGRIAYVGANVADLAVGDLVTANPHLFCGVCRFCRDDRPEICENRPIIGWHRPGGFAELVAVRASNVYPLSPAIPATVAALGEPLAVGVHAVRRADFEPGSVALVIGPGPIGLLIGLACQEAGAKRVVVAGLGADAMRLDVARAIGLETAVIGDPASVGRLNESLERDVSVTVFEASGAPDGIRTALELAPKDGKVLVLGIPHDLVPINIAALAFAEKQLIGCRGFAPRDWTRSVEIIERRTEDLGRLVTSKLPLADHDAAFQSLRERTAIKIMLSAKPHS